MCKNYHHAHKKNHQIKSSAGNWQMKSPQPISLLQPMLPSCLLELAGYLQSDPELHDANTGGKSLGLGFLAPPHPLPLVGATTRLISQVEGDEVRCHFTRSSDCHTSHQSPGNTFTRITTHITRQGSYLGSYLEFALLCLQLNPHWCQSRNLIRL